MMFLLKMMTVLWCIEGFVFCLRSVAIAASLTRHLWSKSFPLLSQSEQWRYSECISDAMGNHIRLYDSSNQVLVEMVVHNDVRTNNEGSTTTSMHVATATLRVVDVLSLLLSNRLSSFTSYLYRTLRSENVVSPRIAIGKVVDDHLMGRTKSMIDLSRDYAAIMDLSFELQRSCDSKAIYFWRKTWEHSVSHAKELNVLCVVTCLIMCLKVTFLMFDNIVAQQAAAQRAAEQAAAQRAAEQAAAQRAAEQAAAQRAAEAVARRERAVAELAAAQREVQQAAARRERAVAELAAAQREVQQAAARRERAVAELAAAQRAVARQAADAVAQRAVAQQPMAQQGELVEVGWLRPKFSPGQKAQAWARQDDFETIRCCICWEDFRANRPGSPPHERIGSDGKALLLFPCGHVFDESCFEAWVMQGTGGQKCPTCSRPWNLY